MKITKKRILSLNRYLSFLEDEEEFYVSYKITGLNDHLLSRVGFTKPYTAGHTILPAILGPTSKKNAEGYFILLKDKPKKDKDFWGVITDWHGYEHTTSYSRKCWQKKFIPPYNIEIMLVKDAATTYRVI